MIKLLNHPRSEAQRETSRLNGAKSQGPVSLEGKAHSALNGLKHGILAQTILLPHESVDALNELLEGMYAEFAPRSLVESALVETMAVARWRLMRTWAMETSGLAREMRLIESAAGPDSGPGDAPTRAAGAFQHMADKSRCLDLINRAENRYERQYVRALETFHRHRKALAGATRTPEPVETKDWQ